MFILDKEKFKNAVHIDPRTQTEIGRPIGWNQPSVSRRLRILESISLKSFLALCNELKVDPREYFAEVQPPTRKFLCPDCGHVHGNER